MKFLKAFYAVTTTIFSQLLREFHAILKRILLNYFKENLAQLLIEFHLIFQENSRNFSENFT